LKESFLFTSSITLAEFYVKPKRANDEMLIQRFKSILPELGFYVADVTAVISESSAELRSKYRFLKLVDSIQLATALNFRCNVFFSNDKELAAIKELQIILVDNLIHEK